MSNRVYELPRIINEHGQDGGGSAQDFEAYKRIRERKASEAFDAMARRAEWVLDPRGEEAWDDIVARGADGGPEEDALVAYWHERWGLSE